MTRRYLGTFGPFVLIAMAYFAVATYEIALPGIYMDAVNPDYLVVRWLNPTAKRIPVWLAPGNDISGRFPVMVGLHHGSLQLWLGYPAFWLFGTTVTGLRLTHALFGLGVLAALHALLRVAGLPRGWVVAFAVALAVDPAFVYAFRTQSYITMAPAAFLLLAVLCNLKARTAEGDVRSRWVAGSGFLIGLACWGYFVYAFFIPVLAIATWFMSAPDESAAPRLKRVALLGAGIAAGGSGYLLGYALMIKHAGGLANAWAHVVAVQPGLGIAGASLSLDVRARHVTTIWSMVVGSAWHHAMMFADDTPMVGAPWKFALLALVPPAVWAILAMQRRATPLLRITLGLQLSFLFCAGFFGTRLAGHHFMPLVPLGYAALAASVIALPRDLPRRPAWLSLPAAALVALVALNILGDAREVETLRRTGGVANFSDAINRLGADLLAGDHDRLVILPDWGLYMPVAFLTRATMEMASEQDYALARRRLCEGKDVVVGLIGDDRNARFNEWQRRLDWTAPKIATYRQRDGAVVFETGTFFGVTRPKGCATM